MALVECQEQMLYRVPLENGSSNSNVEYLLRGLDEDEVRPWSEFCANVFSYKTNPPPAEYFYRHYANDPTTKAPGSSKLIRVALLGGEIVATCRIFLKEISTGIAGKSILSAGIGEVCTSVPHRRRGLSKKLLENAIAILEDRCSEVQISSLHAAPTFFPLYESLGYVAPPVSNPSGGNRWSTMDFCWKPNHCRNDKNFVIRQAEFPNDTKLLQRLHATYSEERLVGCILRSEEYWNDYLSKELEGSFHVLVESGQILAWLSLSGTGDSFCVREFGIDTSYLENQMEEDDSLSMDCIVGALIAHAIEQQTRIDGSCSSFNTIRSSIKLPGFVSDEIRKLQDSSDELSCFDWESERTDIDRGWMYRGVGTSGTTAVTNEFLGFLQGTTVTTPSGEESYEKSVQRREHFVWPSDSF